MTDVASEATIPVKASFAGTKIHGPNSPLVLSGEVPVGHREDVPFEGGGTKVVEVNYQTAVEMFGVEEADKLFAGLTEEALSDE